MCPSSLIVSLWMCLDLTSLPLLTSFWCFVVDAKVSYPFVIPLWMRSNINKYVITTSSSCCRVRMSSKIYDVRSFQYPVIRNEYRCLYQQRMTKLTTKRNTLFNHWTATYVLYLRSAKESFNTISSSVLLMCEQRTLYAICNILFIWKRNEIALSPIVGTNSKFKISFFSQ